MEARENGSSLLREEGIRTEHICQCRIQWFLVGNRWQVRSHWRELSRHRDLKGWLNTTWIEIQSKQATPEEDF